jgi:hypothetical protein
MLIADTNNIITELRLPRDEDLELAHLTREKHLPCLGKLS